MILSFPSPIYVFEVVRPVVKAAPIRYAHVVQQPFEMIFTPPIDLQVHDHVWIDIRDSSVHIVERGGIAIWRAAWLN